MTKNQNIALQFLSKIKSCSDEQLIFFTGCSNQDIKYLIASNFIVKDAKTNLLHHKMKKVDVRTSVKEVLICKYPIEIIDKIN